MRRKVQLYIAGRQVDLGDDSWVLYNWTREDMANPTAVVNSSSQQVTLPGTCRNNAVFGSAFRLDRRTLFGGSYDGTQFDPTRKTPFILYDNAGTVLESGYCRLDEVNTNSRRHAYTVTLYGGLGSLFYTLAMKEDGTARTLADMVWKGDDGNDIESFNVWPGASSVSDAWEYLRTGVSPFLHLWNVLNFAPAYNGLPDDFDAAHALMSSEAWANIPDGMDEDGERPYDYTYKAGLDCALVSFTNPHTEWELGDLRWYLQRPVVSVKAFIAAVCDPRNNGGYTVDLDDTFFTDDNPAYAAGWWTLGMIAAEDRTSAECLTRVLAASKSPMDYLVSFCKIYGLVFLWDSSRHKVRILTRATFYGENADVIDLTERIDRKDIKTDPVLADRRWYQLGDGGKGAFADQYKRDYGRGYAVQRIDTGYEFDAGTKVLTEGLAFQDAAEVSETDRLFSAAVDNNLRGARNHFQLPRYEGVTIELWNEAGESQTFDLQCRLDTNYYDNPAHPFTDWLPKVQLHGDDDKAQDGADVLLYFAGIKEAPLYGSGGYAFRKQYHITEDSAAMTDLNGGPCWDLTGTGTQVWEFPTFRRVWLSGRYITESFEWGAPQARPVPDISYPTGNPAAIYDRWWKRYLTDRYAVDTRVMTTMVNWRGLQVGQDLLRRFYWYDGALWVLNAIRNHPLTSWDLTECEFVKVGDKNAYTEGPGAALTKYLIITPDSQSFTLNPSGETLTLEVKSSSAWTLTLPGIVSWINIDNTSGPAGTTTINIAAQTNSTSGRRQTTVTLTNTEGETLSFNLTQQPAQGGAISLNPAAMTIPATGTTPTDGSASRGRTCRVEATGAWDVDASTVPSWLKEEGGGLVLKSSVGLTLKCAANSGSERSAQIKVYLTGDMSVWAILAVTQEAGSGGNGGITLTDNNGNGNTTVPNTGGTVTLVVTIPDGAGWTIASSANWATLSKSSGSGNDTLTVTVPNYTGSSDRSCTITAKRDGYNEGAVFYLYQAAPAASQDYIQLTRADAPLYNNIEIDGNGGTGFPFDVRASGSWSVASQSSWLHPMTQYGAWSGSGNKTLWFSVDSNSGAARTGTIKGTHSVTGEVSFFYVYQSGDGTVTLAASFNKSSIDSSAQTIYLQIQVPSGLAWSIDQVSSGLTPQTYSGSGPTEISVSVTQNTGTQRTLSLRVRNAMYGLSATPSVIQNTPSSSNYLRVSPFGTVNKAATDTYVDFTIESNTAWSVSKAAADTDVTLSTTSGSGNGTVRVSFPASISNTARTIPITFSGASTINVSIVQAAGQGGLDVTVTPQVVNLSGAGGTSEVTLGATGNWTASPSASWISVSPASGGAGQGQTLTIGGQRNQGAGARSGSVTVTCGSVTRTITVNQPTSADLTVSSDAVELDADNGAQKAITVYASGTWDIDEYTDIPLWLDVVMGAHGGSSEGETLTFKAKSENTSGSTRTATIKLILVDNPSTYQTVTVTQKSQSALYVSPTAANGGNGVGTGFIHVTCNTSWEIYEIGSGITIASSAQSGTGDADVMYAYTANPDEEVRRIRVKFRTTDQTKEAMFTLIQAAAQPAIQFDPDTPLRFETDNEGGTLQLQRTVIATGSWTAASSASWLQFTPTSGNAGSTVVTFTARGSLTQVLNATWTVTRGDKTKTLGATCMPAPSE